jgi:uncharacterized protein (TIGR02996 family)
MSRLLNRLSNLWHRFDAPAAPVREADAFLQAIRATPDDDTPRLVYADWLEEHGEPRGEFIRVQCEIPRLPAAHPRSIQLQSNERRLLRAHRAHWVEPLRPFVGFWQAQWVLEFRRGFVERIDIDAEVFLRHGEELFRHAPLRQVSFSSARGRLPALTTCRYLAEIEELSFLDQPLEERDLTALAACPYLSRMKKLALVTNGLTVTETQIFSRTLNRARVTEVRGPFGERVLIFG